MAPNLAIFPKKKTKRTNENENENFILEADVEH